LLANKLSRNVVERRQLMIMGTGLSGVWLIWRRIVSSLIWLKVPPKRSEFNSKIQ
jgi:hypothetical protein